MFWWIVGELTRVRLEGFTNRPSSVKGRTLTIDLSEPDLALFMEVELPIGARSFRLRAPGAVPRATPRYLQHSRDLGDADVETRRTFGRLIGDLRVAAVHLSEGDALVEMEPGTRPDMAVVRAVRTFVRAARAGTLKGGAAAWPCPVCTDAVLVPTTGPLAEPMCPVCRGHLVPAELARELVYEPRGITPGDLADADGTGAARCPACARAMSPVLLDEDIVDVCRGCGALWLDDGELARVTHGRVDG